MPGNLKHQLYHQLIQFLMIGFYLFIVFGILALHEFVVAAKNHIEYHFYGFALINALILGKVMLVAEDLHFASWFRDNPPAYSVVCKSIAFTILFLVFDIVEEITVGRSIERKDDCRELSQYRRRKSQWGIFYGGHHRYSTDPVLCLQRDRPSDR